MDICCLRNGNLYFAKWKSVPLFDSVYSVFEMPKYSENSDGARKLGVFVAKNTFTGKCHVRDIQLKMSR